MSIAVVIPVYNRPKLILRALARVSDQSRLPDKLVVVDDGSTDDTGTVAERWLADNAGFPWQIVRTGNRGVAAARNAGATATAGLNAIAFLDSDDEWPADFLAAAVAALERHPNALGAVADRLTLMDGNQVHQAHAAEFTADPVLWMLQHGAAMVTCSLFRRAAFDKIGGFDAAWRTGEDTRFFMALAPEGRLVPSRGMPVVVHCRPTASADGDVASISMASKKLFWTWARQMEQLLAELPADHRRAREAAIAETMAGRWGRTVWHMRQGNHRLLARHAQWRQFVWQKRHARALAAAH